jgi:hypothetical protein
LGGQTSRYWGVSKNRSGGGSSGGICNNGGDLAGCRVDLNRFIFTKNLVLMEKEKMISMLIALHRKYSKEQKSNRDSQMCTFWSIDNPPDVLEGTPALIAIEEKLDITFEEEEAVDFYDKTIEEAAKYIANLIKH